MFCNEDYSVGNSYLIEVSDKVILQGVCCCWLLAASMNSSTELQLCCSMEEGLFSVLSSFITFDKLVSVPEFWLHFIVVSVWFFCNLPLKFIELNELMKLLGRKILYEG